MSKECKTARNMVLLVAISLITLIVVMEKLV